MVKKRKQSTYSSSLQYLRGHKEIQNKERPNKNILDFKGLSESLKYKHTKPLKLNIEQCKQEANNGHKRNVE